MDQMVNNNWLVWISVCTLRTYRTYNPTVKILKYEFNNKLLSGEILLKREKRYLSFICLVYKERKMKRKTHSSTYNII